MSFRQVLLCLNFEEFFEISQYLWVKGLLIFGWILKWFLILKNLRIPTKVKSFGIFPNFGICLRFGLELGVLEKERGLGWGKGWVIGLRLGDFLKCLKNFPLKNKKI